MALICAAVLLLSGARNLALLSAPNASQRSIARRAYFLAFVLGVNAGIVVDALALPEQHVTTLVMTVGITGVLVTLGLLRPPLARRLPWDPGMAAVGFLSFVITVDAITRFASL